MGARGSKSTVKQTAINKMLTDVMVNNMQNASSIMEVNQNVDIVNEGSGTIEDVKITQATVFDSKIFQSSENVIKLQNELKSAIDGQASASGSGVFSALGGSDANLIQELRNEVTQKINTQTMQDMSTNINQNQNVRLLNKKDGTIRGIDVSQTQEVFRQAAQDTIAKFDSVTKMDNLASGQADAVTTNPISEIIDSVFSGLTGIWILVLIGIIVCVVVGYFAFNKFLGSDAGSQRSALRGLSSLSKHKLKAKALNNEALANTNSLRESAFNKLSTMAQDPAMQKEAIRAMGNAIKK